MREQQLVHVAGGPPIGGAQRPTKAKFSREMPRSELLHGVETQGAFIALFDKFDDFNSMAHEVLWGT
jgi:hypothetical protein